jgi:hypothetical protein
MRSERVVTQHGRVRGPLGHNEAHSVKDFGVVKIGL